MPELFLELFSEEIPARMQEKAAGWLKDISEGVFESLLPREFRMFSGPRRIAMAVSLEAEKPGGVLEARGPKDSAPEAALTGFLGKNRADREELVIDGGYYWLRRNAAPVPASVFIQGNLVAALESFQWTKSMRWGQSGNFKWVRPLRRIVCLLDGEVVPITVGPIVAGNLTEGHRFMAPGEIAVESSADWEAKLRGAKVFVSRPERLRSIVDGLRAKTETLGLSLANDEPLLDEVTGLVEWPVALIGEIGAQFMDLPPEVRELSMKVNQRYFALRDAAGEPAPYFAFVSNIEAADGGAAIIAGNERVLRARLADARHFWDLDLKTPLDALLPKLGKVIFHAKFGTQLARAERIAALARRIATALGADEDLCNQAEHAGRLCKADLVTLMVGEFPELQGVMGGYYAEKNPRGWDGAIVGPAIRTHYQPKGPDDAVPAGIAAAAVALADKLDTLVKFFGGGEKPSGSRDPYALRRAALGVIRIIITNEFSLRLKPFLDGDRELFAFIIERLRVKMRSEGQRFDVVNAVLGISGDDDDLLRLLRRARYITEFLETSDGTNLLAGYRRAVNILRIEDLKDGPHPAEDTYHDYQTHQANDLRDKLIEIAGVGSDCAAGVYAPVLARLAQLRAPVDGFFDNVTVNAADPKLRLKHLRLLAKLRDTMHLVADFSKIEG